ncbi:hypothetical protein IFM89_026560 [Coptis chinensis]|uniref:Serpin domain-containing protein n=1 Tax=Coptis chinensis TaxID=261450 RepID=A0A835HHL3_9MAGN|nr:hypothetical protein IFM89_026560 [Coptis chinensis]
MDSDKRRRTLRKSSGGVRKRRRTSSQISLSSLPSPPPQSARQEAAMDVTELLTFLEAENLNDLNSVATELIDILTESTKDGPILSFVGGLWVSCNLKPTFVAIGERIYKAKAESVDFRNKAKEVTEKVNKWAEEATNGLIHKVADTSQAPEIAQNLPPNAETAQHIVADEHEEEDLVETLRITVPTGEQDATRNTQVVTHRDGIASVGARPSMLPQRLQQRLGPRSGAISTQSGPSILPRHLQGRLGPGSGPQDLSHNAHPSDEETLMAGSELLASSGKSVSRRSQYPKEQSLSVPRYSSVAQIDLERDMQRSRSPNPDTMVRGTLTGRLMEVIRWLEIEAVANSGPEATEPEPSTILWVVTLEPES